MDAWMFRDNGTYGRSADLLARIVRPMEIFGRESSARGRTWFPV
jgi:hypothetical protein